MIGARDASFDGATLSSIRDTAERARERIDELASPPPALDNALPERERAARMAPATPLAQWRDEDSARAVITRAQMLVACVLALIAVGCAVLAPTWAVAGLTALATVACVSTVLLRVRLMALGPRDRAACALGRGSSPR